MKFLKRLFARPEPQPTPRPLSPMEVYTRYGAVPTGRTAEILFEAERGWQRRQQEEPSMPEAAAPRRPSTVADDEAILRMLAGANFGPNASVILPTGREISAGESQALTSFYAPDAEEDR